MSNRKKLSRVQKRKTKLAKQEQKRKKLQKRQTAESRGLNLASLAESFRSSLESMWTQEKIEAMETVAIIQKLNELGIEFDEDIFRSAAHEFYSPSDLSEHLWSQESDLIDGVDGDFPWMSAGVLWQRFCPEIVNCEMIIDGIDEGYMLLDQGKLVAACDRWLQVWDDLKSRFLKGTKTIDTVEDRIGDYYSVSGWLVSFEMELGNACLDNPATLQKRITFCTEVSELLPDSPADFLEQMGCGIAESHFMLGDAKTGDAAFEALASKLHKPSWVFYSTWGGLWSGKFRSKATPDYQKAKERYEQAAALASPGDLEEIYKMIEGLPFKLEP